MSRWGTEVQICLLWGKHGPPSALQFTQKKKNTHSAVHSLLCQASRSRSISQSNHPIFFFFFYSRREQRGPETGEARRSEPHCTFLLDWTVIFQPLECTTRCPAHRDVHSGCRCTDKGGLAQRTHTHTCGQRPPPPAAITTPWGRRAARRREIVSVAGSPRPPPQRVLADPGSPAGPR